MDEIGKNVIQPLVQFVVGGVLQIAPLSIFLEPRLHLGCLDQSYFPFDYPVSTLTTVNCRVVRSCDIVRRMDPDWYYTDEGGGQFVVFADANDSCSMRVFGAADGTFIREDKAGTPGATYATHYRKEIKSMKGRIGAVSKRPNLQDAVRKRKLPDDVLAELKRLKRNLVG